MPRDRAALSDQARRWVEGQVGRPIISASRMRGGVSSRMYDVRLEDGSSVALRLLAARSPLLLAIDETGEHAGLRAVLQTRLPGQPVVTPTPAPPWCDNKPKWLSVQQRLYDALPLSNAPIGLIHRDLHPGNILFDGGALSGIVDWVNASWGPVEVDIAKCRVEVAMLTTIEVADALLAQVADIVSNYDRMWDMVVLIELWTDPQDLLVFNAIGASLTEAGMRKRVNELLAAVA